MTENEIRASMTSDQILLERKLTCEAINGAIAFGYLDTNPPPADDHWLAPFWKIGRERAELEAKVSTPSAPAVDAGALRQALEDSQDLLAAMLHETRDRGEIEGQMVLNRKALASTEAAAGEQVATRRAHPTERGIYAWINQGSGALVQIHTRPTVHSKGGVLNGSVISNSKFYDGCEIAQWTGGTWYGPLDHHTAPPAASQEASVEPVAKVDEGDDGLFVEILYGEDGSRLKRGDKLYTTPPAASGQKLTDEQIDERVIAALTTLGRPRLWSVVTFESGPYRVNKVSRDFHDFAEALLRASSATASDKEGQS